MKRLCVFLLCLFAFSGTVSGVSDMLMLDNKDFRDIMSSVNEVNFVVLMQRISLTEEQRKKIIVLIDDAIALRNKNTLMISKDKNKIIAEFNRLREILVKDRRFSDKSRQEFEAKMGPIGLQIEDYRQNMNQLVETLWGVLTEEQQRIILAYDFKLFSFLEENVNPWEGSVKLEKDDQEVRDRIETIFFREDAKAAIEKLK